MTFSTPQKLRRHLQKHNIQIPQITVGIRQYNNDEYTDIKTECSHNSIEKHFGCPACIIHCVKINTLKTHFYTCYPKTAPEEEPQQLQEQPTAEQQQQNEV